MAKHIIKNMNHNLGENIWNIIEVQYINLKNPQTKNDQTFDQASHRIENQNGQAI